MLLFFSWQSDIPENRHLINSALHALVPALNEVYPNLHVNIDEATRDVSGAPDIVDCILKKISVTDVFICDITPVVNGKDIVNSNVMFELGIASQCIGWSRIILLFNESSARISQVPFDIRNHRITFFKVKECSNSSIGQLCSKLKIAVSSIIDSKPPKKILDAHEAELIKKRRDIENINWIFSRAFCFQIWDNFFESYPTGYWDDSVLEFWDIFANMYSSLYFHFYDAELKNLFQDFAEKLHKVFRDSTPLFRNNGHGRIIPVEYWDASGDELFDETVILVNDAGVILCNIIKYIREHFLEVNLDELSNDAYKHYIQEQNDLRERTKKDLED